MPMLSSLNTLGTSIDLSCFPRYKLITLRQAQWRTPVILALMGG